jgi:hypothetical protein
VISDFGVGQEMYDCWTVSGTVTDGDNSVAGMVVSFGGVLAGYGYSAVVGADGTFSVTEIFAGLQSGTATAQTTDPCGQASNQAEYWVVV